MMKPDRRTSSDSIARLGKVVAGAVGIDAALTLAGQPSGFWRDPQGAIRADLLSIHHPTNHSFEYFLSSGWEAYIAAMLAFLVLVGVALAVLPRRVGRFLAFGILFVEFWDTSNWLSTRWHAGAATLYICGPLLGAAVSWSIGGEGEEIRSGVRRLRWIVLAAIGFDFAVTLLGQPARFWFDPSCVNEGNPLFRFFLLKGWETGFGCYLAYLGATFALLSSVNPRLGRWLAFAFLFGHFAGAMSWLFYHWRMAPQTLIPYSLVLAAGVSWSIRGERRTGLRSTSGPPFEAGLNFRTKFLGC